MPIAPRGYRNMPAAPGVFVADMLEDVVAYVGSYVDARTPEAWNVTAVQNGSYTLAPADFALMNPPGGGATSLARLPARPPDGAPFGVFLTAAGSVVLTPQGGDTLILATGAGALSLTMSRIGEVIMLRYNAALGAFLVLSHSGYDTQSASQPDSTQIVRWAGLALNVQKQSPAARGDGIKRQGKSSDRNVIQAALNQAGSVKLAKQVVFPANSDANHTVNLPIDDTMAQLASMVGTPSVGSPATVVINGTSILYTGTQLNAGATVSGFPELQGAYLSDTRLRPAGQNTEIGRVFPARSLVQLGQLSKVLIPRGYYKLDFDLHFPLPVDTLFAPMVGAGVVQLRGDEDLSTLPNSGYMKAWAVNLAKGPTATTLSTIGFHYTAIDQVNKRFTGVDSRPSAVTGSVANNNAIRWVSLVTQAGNLVALTGTSAPAMVNNGASLPLTVTVGANNKVTVQLATNNAGQVISTAAQVIAAVNADPVANLILNLSLADATINGAGVVQTSAAISQTGEWAIGTLAAGSIVSQPGTDEGRVLITVPDGVDLEIAAGAELDFTDCHAFEEATQGGAYGPYWFQVTGGEEVFNDPVRGVQNNPVALTQDARQGDYFLHTLPQSQPNVDLFGSTNFFAIHRTLRLGSWQYAGTERQNPIGEQCEVAPFPANWLSGAITAGATGAVNYKNPLAVHYFYDPNSLTATTAGDLPVGSPGPVALTAASAQALIAADFEAGCFYSSVDGEQIWARFDRVSGTLYDIRRDVRADRRALHGGGAWAFHDHPAGTVFTHYSTIVFEPGTANEEDVMFTSAGSSNFTIPAPSAGLPNGGRGVNGTAPAAHADLSIVTNILNPGIVPIKNPVAEYIPYRRGGRRARATVLGALTSTSAGVNESIDVNEDLSGWHPVGEATITSAAGTEIINYRWRTHGGLRQVTRGLYGTAQLDHPANATVQERAVQTTLTSDLQLADTLMHVQGAPGNDLVGFRPSTDSYARVRAPGDLLGGEIIQIVSGGQGNATNVAIGADMPAGTEPGYNERAQIVPCPNAATIPLAAPFWTIIDLEVIYVTAIDATGAGFGAGTPSIQCQRGVYGTLPAHHTAGTNMKIGTTLKMKAGSSNNPGRGALWSEVPLGAWPAGSVVEQVDGAMLRLLDHAKGIKIWGGGHLFGLDTSITLPRTLAAGGIGTATSGSTQTAFDVRLAKDCLFAEGLRVEHAERATYQFTDILNCWVRNPWIRGCNQQGNGNSIIYNGASQDSGVIGGNIEDARHAFIASSSVASIGPGVYRRLRFIGVDGQGFINSAFEFQNSGDDVIVLGCHLRGGNLPLKMSIATVLMADNVFTGNPGGSLLLGNLTHRPVNWIIRNNRIEDTIPRVQRSGGTPAGQGTSGGGPVMVQTETGVNSFSMMLLENIDMDWPNLNRAASGISIDPVSPSAATSELAACVGFRWRNIRCKAQMHGAQPGSSLTSYQNARVWIQQCEDCDFEFTVRSALRYQPGVVLSNLLDCRVRSDVTFRQQAVAQTSGAQPPGGGNWPGAGVWLVNGCRNVEVLGQVKNALMPVYADSTCAQIDAKGVTGVSCASASSVGTTATVNGIVVLLAGNSDGYLLRTSLAHMADYPALRFQGREMWVPDGGANGRGGRFVSDGVGWQLLYSAP